MSRVDAKYLELLRTRYRVASKKEKGVILDEVVKTTGYDRKYAIALLNRKRDYVKHSVRRPHKTTYTSALIQPPLMLHGLFDGICSKRLSYPVCMTPAIFRAAQRSTRSSNRSATCRPTVQEHQVTWLHKTWHIAQAPDPHTDLG